MTEKNSTGICVVLAALWLGLIAFVSLNSSPPGAQALHKVASWFPFPNVAARFLQCCQCLLVLACVKIDLTGAVQHGSVVRSQLDRARDIVDGCFCVNRLDSCL